MPGLAVTVQVAMPVSLSALTLQLTSWADLGLEAQGAIEAAGLGSAEGVEGEVHGVRAFRIDGRGEPGDGELGELDGICDRRTALRGDGGGGDLYGLDGRTLGDGAEVFGEEVFELLGVEVAGDGDAGVVGGVELLVEVANVIDAGGFDIGVGADDVAVVGVFPGEEELEHLFIGEVVGLAFALAALIADDVTLVGELGAVQAFHEEAHAVRLKPEAELKLVGGEGLEVVGAVEVGGAVDVGRACSLDVLDVGFLADVLRAFKHHVLKEVGEASAAGALVERADVVPEVDGDEGEAVILVGDDLEAVGEGVGLVLDLRELEGGGGWGGGVG